MERFEIAGHVLEYYDETHEYLVDGIIVPSVTQILKRRFGGKYNNVSQKTLDNAARLGTMLHEAIATFEAEGADYTLPAASAEISDEFAGYRILRGANEFTVNACELPLILTHKGDVVGAGRMDLLIEWQDKPGIADIKRTAQLDKDYLSYQMTLYARALKYSYGQNAEHLHGIHLRKTVRKFVDIPFCDGLADELLDEVWEEMYGDCG